MYTYLRPVALLGSWPRVSEKAVADGGVGIRFQEGKVGDDLRCGRGRGCSVVPHILAVEMTRAVKHSPHEKALA